MHADLHFAPLRCLFDVLVVGRHVARVVEQHVQLCLGGEELLGCRLDGVQVGEIKGEEYEGAVGCGLGLRDVCDGV